MAKRSRIWFCIVCLLCSISLNVFFLLTTTNNLLYFGSDNLSWSTSAASEAEFVASFSCSGHGRAYLDGVLEDGKKPICECNTCYEGSDCSKFLTDCAAKAESGDPLFLEPFWMYHSASSAILISGWHRMSYVFPEKSLAKSYMSQELENHIRKVHTIAKNAIIDDKYMIFGVGSTQLLGAAVFALSMNLSSAASVVSASPFYSLYKTQTEFFQTVHFEYAGDALLFKNNSNNSTANVIEIVASPNNPDGNLRHAVLRGPSVKTIYDHAYYWPHFTAIPAPSNEDIMIFTMSKLTGHAGSRFGWAFVKDKAIYERMLWYIAAAEMGTSRETQLRALKLMKTILEGNGTEIFNFAHKKMKQRWEKLSAILSLSSRFTMQEIQLQYCNFFDKVRGPSPAYAWLKCEREEDTNCTSVLQEANILGRGGSSFSVEDRYVRLSLLKSDDDFNLLLSRLDVLISKEDGGSKTMAEV